MSIYFKRLKDLLPVLVDPELGIISYVQELPRQNDSPDFIYYKAEIADTGIYGLKTNRPTTGGTALDRDRAMAKAIGEAIERYSSAIYFQSDLPLSTFGDLSMAAVHPHAFRIHTDEQLRRKQFPLDVFDEYSRIRWVPATNLHTRDEILVPAGFVYCPYTPDFDAGEAEIAEFMSTGLAAHCSHDEAALNGILEVVERDSFMTTWLAKESCPVLDPATMTELHNEMITRFMAFGYKITLLSAAKDAGIPTFIAVMKGYYPGSVPFVVSAAAHLSPDMAVTKCLEELALMERYCKRMMLQPMNWVPGKKYENVVKLIDHLKYWLNPDVIQQAEFLTTSDQKVSLSDIPNLLTGDPHQDLSRLVQRILDSGYQVLVSDITTEDIDALGLKVVRALIPGYVPLTIHYANRPEGSPRLLRYLEKKGLSAAGQRVINLLPHPFA